MNIDDYITVDPNVCHGKSCFRATRIMVHLVLDLMENGIPIEEIIGPDYYPELTENHVRAALHYASQLLKSKGYAA